MYGWGGGKRSEVLNARRNQNPCELNGKLKSYRDRIVALGGNNYYSTNVGDSSY